MSTAQTRRTAEQIFNTGNSLFLGGQYKQAVVELKKAEEAFQSIDVVGHPFIKPLANGISGIANALAVQGMCHQKMGDCSKAVTCYETSLINAKFERRRPFRSFVKELRENLISCYEDVVRKSDSDYFDERLRRDPDIDISYRFPFSLQPDIIPAARLYELSPERHRLYKDFYLRAAQKDAQLRRLNKTTDETTMRNITITVWGILLIQWTIYSMLVIKTLFHKP